MNSLFKLTSEVASALETGRPVLALESTIISHGMPYPQNLEFAMRAEQLVRDRGVVPATIAIQNGKACIGLSEIELQVLVQNNEVKKVATRDLGIALAEKSIGATTVSATMHLAHQVGIKVFATGGIGGVHRSVEKSFDISQDLRELGRTPMVVVSAGCKAILDIPRTIEYLETEGVSVLGYQTDDFPAFYSRKSGSPAPGRIESCTEIAELYRLKNIINQPGAILIANPVPHKDEIMEENINTYIEQALGECRAKNIIGKKVTPFLLGRIVELTGGKSLKTNIALAMNNIKLGAEIALAIQMK